MKTDLQVLPLRRRDEELAGLVLESFVCARICRSPHPKPGGGGFVPAGGMVFRFRLLKRPLVMIDLNGPGPDLLEGPAGIEQHDPDGFVFDRLAGVLHRRPAGVFFRRHLRYIYRLNYNYRWSYRGTRGTATVSILYR
jgi:hypothetical protein